MPADHPTDRFSADRPIVAHSDDRFGRWPFASRIAGTIRDRVDRTSIVIGVYAPWGDGKTSVMNMMQEALKEAPNVITVRFNPWYFRGDEQLIRGFFDELASSIDATLPTSVEKLGTILNKYGAWLSVITPYGEHAEKIGERLSTAGIEILKGRVDKCLREAKKRVVVFIDDIDRLERHEIQSVLKVVKLSADFENTAYVLFFDDKVVADSLGERYGAGDAQAGRAFLEKIIQVPLHLPPAKYSQFGVPRI